MSGCVNCVWDAYREEVEEWAAARRKREGEELQMRMDEGASDEGGSSLDLGGVEGGELFEGVPVGIREFMDTEKRLRERRLAGRAG